MRYPHDALYRAVCCNPDEDSPRLLFADLIEEEGDDTIYPDAGPQRAAFIRTQVALSRVSDYDPLSVSTRQLSPDSFFGSAMMHTFPRLPAAGGYDWGDYQFRRGFPWQVAVNSLDRFIVRGQEIFELAPIQSLDILDFSGTTLAAIAHWPQLARIRRLGFVLGRYGRDAIHQLTNSQYAQSVQELSFESDSLAAGGLETLVRSSLFRHLQSLAVQNCTINPGMLVDALGAHQEPVALKRLSLRGNRLYSDDLPDLFSLPLLKGLECLDLSENSLGSMAAVLAFAENGLGKGLKEFNLRRTRLGMPELVHLTESGVLADVQALDLSHNRLLSRAGEILAGARSIQNLRSLNLASNSLGDRGAIAVANAPVLARLVELDLSDCEVGDAGARALSESPFLGGLLRLNLVDRDAHPGLSGKTRRALTERFGQRVSC